MVYGRAPRQAQRMVGMNEEILSCGAGDCSGRCVLHSSDVIYRLKGVNLESVVQFL